MITRRYANRITRFVAIGIALACVSLSASAVLPEVVSAALQSTGIPAAHVTMWVAPASGGAAGIRHNADDAFNPASVMKLVTSSAALEVLGPGFMWSTDAYVQGDLRDGVLTGNLVLRGSGDPALTWDRFGNLLRELRSRGLRDIHGDVIIDRSLFVPAGVENFDDQPQRAYNATPDAFLVNFKAISVRLVPRAPKQDIQATALTPLAPFFIDNTLTATSGACSDWRSAIRSEFVTQGDVLRLRLSGSMPAGCGEQVLNLAMQDGLRMTGSVFRALWQELGGTLSGSVRDGSTPVDGVPLATWRSPPLAEVLRDMNKYSNNLMARHLLLTLGVDSTRQPVTPLQGAQRVRDWLASRQITLPILVLENGSGLSRRERISAAGLGGLLQTMWQSPRMPDLVASLPIAGEDGTAKRRFGNLPVSGHAYLKTGSLNDVMATGGFVQDASGQWQVIVFIINDARAELGEAATIAAVRYVFEHGSVLTQSASPRLNRARN